MILPETIHLLETNTSTQDLKNYIIAKYGKNPLCGLFTGHWQQDFFDRTFLQITTIENDPNANLFSKKLQVYCLHKYATTFKKQYLILSDKLYHLKLINFIKQEYCSLCYKQGHTQKYCISDTSLGYCHYCEKYGHTDYICKTK